MLFNKNFNKKSIFILFFLSLFISNKDLLSTPWSGNADESWYNSVRTHFVLDSASQLAGLADIVNRGDDDFEGKIIELRNDIDIAKRNWIPIGTDSNPFQGVLDGTGHFIMNMRFDSTNAFSGLFGVVGNSAFICNLGITCNNIISGTDYVGGIAGKNEGTISLCFNAGKVSGGQKSGGIVGYNSGHGGINQCYNTGKIENATIASGGIAGDNRGMIDNCYNIGNVSGSSDIGCIVGQRSSAALLENCHYLEVTSISGVGNGSSTGTTAQTSTALKSNGFINVLQGSWQVDPNNFNSGYPVFLWQTRNPNPNYIINATVKNNAGGTITPSGNVFVCLEETFVFTPDECYTVKYVIVDENTVIKDITNYTFSDISGNHSIEVEFETLANDSIFVEVSKGGKVVTNNKNIADIDTVIICDSTTFTIIPDECYVIDKVLIDGIEDADAKTNKQYTFTTSTQAFNHRMKVTFRTISTGSVETIVSEGGRIMPYGDNIPLCGDKTFTIIPDECYVITDVLINGVSDLDAKNQKSYTFKNATGKNVIYAEFAPEYTVTTVASEGGKILPEGTTIACPGKSMAIVPDPCYVVKSVKVNGKSVGAVKLFTFEEVTENVTIEAEFEEAPYKINTIKASVKNNKGGTIEPSGRIYVPNCVDTTFTIKPDSCYVIVDVKIDSLSIGPVESFTFTDLMEDHTIEVEFDASGYSLILARADYGGKIVPYGENNDGLISGTICSDTTFRIIPDTCFAIRDVIVNGKSMGPISSYTFKNVTGINNTIIAAFTNVYRIKASAEGGGTIKPEGLVLGRMCSDTTFTFEPDSCSVVSEVIVNGESIGAVDSYTFKDVRTIHHSIEVKFAPEKFTVEASATAGGIIYPMGTVYLDKCSDSTFRFTPNEECVIAYIIVDGDTLDNTDNSFTFKNIKANHTLHVVFKKNWHITSSADEGGTIEPLGKIFYDETNNTHSYEIIPKTRYKIKDVLVDNLSVGPVENYTFEEVAGIHTIHATFIRTFSIVATCTVNGQIHPEGETIITQNESQKYTITPDKGYKANVFVNGIEMGDIREYEFENVQKNNKIHAIFVEDKSINLTPAKELSIYPNPANATCTITGTLTEFVKDFSINISDINGRKIMDIYSGEKEVGNFNYKFSTEKLPVGTYNVIISTNKASTMKKLVIER
ncbi:MAG: T9SS type A sorting domain-containing protein [Candidatus Kapaibacterium sp.]|jgi:hypothetical protein